MSDAAANPVGGPTADVPPPITLAQLSRWCFGDEAAATAAEEGRDLELPDYPLLRVVAYRFDPEKYRAFLADYRAAAMQDLTQRLAMERLAGIFEKAGVRFAPIKGADIAVNCYPDPALRVRCDLDVLVHPADLDAAERLALADGWRQVAAYEHEYHRPTLVRQNVHLELHFNLPQIGGEHIDYIWEQLIAEPGTTRFRLPPELTALLVFHHARHHQWLTGVAALADLGFMLGKFKKLDWARVDELAEHFGIAAPQGFFHAFAGFFPECCMPPGAPPPEEVLQAIRTAVDAHLNVNCNRELVVGLGSFFSRKWWRRRISGFRPSVVRFTYHLPPGHPFRLLGGYLRMIGDKSRLLVSALAHRSGGEKSALTAVNRAEAYFSGLERK